MPLRLWLYVGLAALAGCYSPPRDACGIQCDTTCPDGFQCTADHVCMPTGGGACPAPSLTFTAFGLGARHACGLDDQSEIYCWGDNSQGQLGLGSSVKIAAAPTRVPGTFTALAVGGAHTCGISDGRVLCWGMNDSGQAAGGAGGIVDTPSPIASKGPPPAFDKIAAGTYATCAIGEGQLWCWGRDSDIGNGGNGTSYMVRIGMLDDWQEITMGGGQACGISRMHGLLCWGANGFHQAVPGQPDALTPTNVGLPNNLVPLHVFTGNQVTCATASTNPDATAGQLWCWGYNGNNVPVSNMAGDLIVPTQVGTDDTWTSFHGSENRACGVRGGEAVCWGQETYGSLGDGFWQHAYTLDQAPSVGPADLVRVTIDSPMSTDRPETVCMLANGKLQCWGENPYGELGIGAPSRHASPVEVAPPMAGLTWTSIVAGHQHACATTSDGALWCWGDDGQGAITAKVARGVDNACIASQPCDAPRPVAAPVNGQIDDIVAGPDYTCTRSGATVNCWGDGGDGVLGRPDSSDHSVSKIEPPRDTWVHLYGGDRGNCGATATELYCWGMIAAVPATTPSLLMAPEIHDIDRLRSGDTFACLRRTDGARVCWGNNDYDQLGDGTQTSDPNPRVIETGIDEMDATHGTGCERTGGAIRCWGINYFRQAGQSVDQNGAVPTPSIVTNQSGQPLSGCTKLALGEGVSCAICNDTVMCWGYNLEGQLGRGGPGPNDAEADAIALPPGMHVPKLLAVGSGAAYMIDGDGHLFAWGDGPHGELGDGGRNANLPAQVAP